MAKTLLELNEVQKDYHIRQYGKVIRSHKALNKLSFKVEKGQIFGFLGPNGAGKTTTIKCITGILKCDEGTILIDGKNIEENGFENKNKIGFLPEQVGLYRSLNAEQTLKYYGGFYNLSEETIEQKGKRLLNLLGLSGSLTKTVNEYSLGMRKRLALATALIHEPEILILDEPTSGLDPRGVKALRNLLLDLNKDGLTILLSSHVLSEVQELCTDVGIINNGEMIRQESISDIMKTVEKTAIKLSLRVENFGKNEEKIFENKKISILENKDIGKHKMVVLKLKENLIPWVTDKLVSNGTKIYSVEPHNTTLEDVFLTETEEN
tara:strand:+ start:93 stop:1058 length:966 start_codon:yes stop_codon:yes gene_type:complete